MLYEQRTKRYGTSIIDRVDRRPLIIRIDLAAWILLLNRSVTKNLFCIGGGVMESMKRNRKILLVVASLCLLATLPATSFAQGRGRGRGQEKKLDKFVNGHDARDGRWDGRGPRIGRRSVISNAIIRQRRADRFRNRDFERNERFRNRELRRRGFDNDDFLRSQRLRHRHFHRRGF